MAKRSKKQKKRVRNLALVCTLTTIVLVASTFAWFIGMRTVNVNSFDVTIAAVDGLSLSLDGEHFTEKLVKMKQLILATQIHGLIVDLFQYQLLVF